MPHATRKLRGRRGTMTRGEILLVCLLASCVLGLVFAGCALSTAHRPLTSQSFLSPTAAAMYDEGAAAFRVGDLENARTKYEGALRESRRVSDSLGVGLSLVALGAVYQTLNDYQQALDLYNAGLPYLHASNAIAAERLTLKTIGLIHSAKKEYAAALQAFETSLPLYDRLLIDSPPQAQALLLADRAFILSQKAFAHNGLEQWAEAVTNYRHAAEEYRGLGDVDRAGQNLLIAALILQQQRPAAPELAELYEDALVLLRHSANINFTIQALTQLGRVYQSLKNFPKAQEAFTEAAKLADQQGQDKEFFLASWGLAEALHSAGAFEQALAPYQAALDRLHRGTSKADAKTEGGILLAKAKILRWLTRYEEAIEHFHAAASKFQESRDVSDEAGVLVELGDLFSWLVDFKTSAEYYKEAAQLYKRDGSVLKQVRVLASLAEVYWFGGGMPAGEVVKNLQDGKTLLDSISASWPSDPLNLLVQMAKEREETFWKEPERFIKQLGDEAQRLDREAQIANAYLVFVLDQTSRSLAELKRQIPDITDEYLLAAGMLYQKWGMIQLSEGRPQEALEPLWRGNLYHFSAPRSRDLMVELAKDWYFIADASLQEGNYGLALHYLRLVEIAAQFLRTPEIYRVYAARARTLERMGQIDAAVSYYRQAVLTLESVQSLQGTDDVRIGVLEGTSHIYSGFAKLLLDLATRTGREDLLREAFLVTEAGKARGFLDMLGKSRARYLPGEVGQLARKSEEIRQQITRIQDRLRTLNVDRKEETDLLDRIDALRQTWRTLIREAARQDPKYAQIAFPSPTSIAQVQAALDSESVVLEYSIAPDRTTLWIISKDKLFTYPIRGLDALPALKPFLETLQEPILSGDELSRHVALGEELYAGLIGPAEHLIRDKKHLIFVPDGVLYYLPFEALIALHAGEARPQSLLDVPYLIKQFQVSYVPSSSVLVQQRSDRPGKQGQAPLPLLAFGDPLYAEREPHGGGTDFPGAGLPELALRGVTLEPLKFSGEEVEQIAGIMGVPVDSNHINLRERATLERLHELDLSQYRIVHFATHAVMGDDIRWTSQPALVLSYPAGKQKPDLLRLTDIFALKLNAELVVLSACETGLGRLRKGEGIVGLTRAFLYAGASSVVVSLWKVEDQSTSLLMEQFYRRLKQGESRAEALRQAKLELFGRTTDLEESGIKQSLAPPFFWAAFILVGDWK